MFKIVKNPTFTTTATIQVPTDDGIVPQTLRVRFRVLPEDEQPQTDDKGLSFLRDAIVHLDDIVDEADNPVSYSEDVRDQLLGRAYVRFGLLAAYFGAQFGRGAAASGN